MLYEASIHIPQAANTYFIQYTPVCSTQKCIINKPPMFYITVREYKTFI